MQVVAHPSTLVLEDEVLGRVAAAKADDPLAPVLIVVPSRRLAQHVARRLAEQFGVVLGVEILHHAALAGRILESAGANVPTVVREELLDALMAGVMRNAAAGPLREFARQHPLAITALRGSLTDLREAGVAPADARRALGGEHAEILALYSLWVEAVDRLLSHDAADHTAVAVAAAGHAGAFAARFRAVIHHGAYELIGVHDRLVQALDGGREVVFLRPAPRDETSAALGVATTFLDAQGASAELETAARCALAAVGSGVPPHEVAIVVRSFGPYASAMDALLDADSLGWNTSYARPLRRDPVVARALQALHDAPAAPVAGFRAHATAFEATAHTTLGDERWAGPAGQALASLISSLGDVETVLEDRRHVGPTDALDWLEARVDTATLPPDGADGGGIRILDAMQARGLTFRRLFLVGMNAGIFPHVGREDPFLPDASRECIRSKTGRPIPLARARDAEEHLILSMLLGATRESLTVSWRRADESGRPVVPSLALRDIARATGIGAGADDVEAASIKLPAHPLSRLTWWASKPGLLRRDEETLLVALTSESGARVGGPVAVRRPDLARGIALVEATDSFAPGDGAYDGRVGPGFAGSRLAATALERLGACPLQYFFHDILRVEAIPEPPSPFEADFAAVGRRVHDVLHATYRALLDEHAFERMTLSSRVARARELLRSAWETKVTDGEASRAADYPVLAAIERERWLATLDAFIEVDLERMEQQRVAPTALEYEVSKEIRGGPEGLIVRARFDRVVEGDDGKVIGDYKTGGVLKKRIGTSDMLTGARLQIPVYALLEDAPVELLGVGPKHVPMPGTDPDPRFVRFEDFKSDLHRAGVLETLRVLAALTTAGRFPLRPGEACDHCDYAAACRRNHPPTLHREEIHRDIADVRDCWAKKDKSPTLAAVRAGRTS